MTICRSTTTFFSKIVACYVYCILDIFNIFICLLFYGTLHSPGRIKDLNLEDFSPNPPQPVDVPAYLCVDTLQAVIAHTVAPLVHRCKQNIHT